MAIYQIQQDAIEKVDPTTFSAANVTERGDLQRLLRTHIGVIAPDTMVLAEEFSEWDESRRRIDLLCLDRNANLVVVELKRTEDGGHMELQAIRYAAMVSTMRFEQAVAAHARFRAALGLSGEAKDEILAFLRWVTPDEARFARQVRIVLASAEFSKEITTTVLWLNQRDLDIRCIRLTPYQLGDRLLLDVQQVIPLPEAEEYQVQVRRKEQAERIEGKDARDMGTIWQELERQRSPEELQLSRELSQWMTDQNGTLVPLAGGFTFKVAVGKRDYYPFKVRTDGQIEVWFQYLRSTSLRTELAARLREIQGIVIPVERVGGKPRFGLAMLVPSDALRRFKAVFEWMVGAVRDGLDEEPAEAEQAGGA